MDNTQATRDTDVDKLARSPIGVASYGRDHLRPHRGPSVKTKDVSAGQGVPPLHYYDI